MVALLAKLVAPVDLTLCRSEPLHVQVTVAPVPIEVTAGFWLPSCGACHPLNGAAGAGGVWSG